MTAVKFDAVDALPLAAAAKLSRLRELVDDRHGAAMGARERLGAVREERQKLQGTISATRNMRGYQNAEHLAKLEADLRQLDAKMRKASEAYDERSARWTAVNRVVQRIEAYVGDLPTGVTIEPYAGPAPQIRSTPADAIAMTRARIEDLRAQMVAVQTAPLPAADQVKRAVAQIDEMAARGEPLLQPDGGIEWPTEYVQMMVTGAPAAVSREMIDAPALLAWLHRDALRKKITALINEQADDEAAVAPADRPPRLAELRANLLTVERLECAAVEMANTDDYRADCDPRAILGLSGDLPAPRDEL